MKKLDIEKELKNTKKEDLIAVVMVLKKKNKKFGIHYLSQKPSNMIDTALFLGKTIFNIEKNLKNRGYKIYDGENNEMYR
jgi:hypothetical protein